MASQQFGFIKYKAIRDNSKECKIYSKSLKNSQHPNVEYTASSRAKILRGNTCKMLTCLSNPKIS